MLSVIRMDLLKLRSVAGAMFPLLIIVFFLSATLSVSAAVFLYVIVVYFFVYTPAAYDEQSKGDYLTGSLPVRREKLVAATAQLLDGDTDTVEKALDDLLERGSVVQEQVANVEGCYLRRCHEAETYVCTRVRAMLADKPDKLRGAKKIIDEIERGQVLAAPGTIHPHTHFKGQVYVLKKEEGGRHTPFFNGYRPQFYFRTTDITGTLQLSLIHI